MIHRTNRTEAETIFRAAVAASTEAHADPYSRDVSSWANDFSGFGYEAGSLVAYAEKSGAFRPARGLFPSWKPNAREILAKHDRANGWAD